jgi:hypothetical protein
MPWFKRVFGTTGYHDEFARFEALFRELGEPRGMMLLRTGRLQGVTLYACFPNTLGTCPFPDFKPAEAPTSAVGLIGHDEDLAKYRSAKTR